ncbi:MAG: transcription elongation factor GreA [Candidatus Dojkabacteria bacterium]
MTIKKTKLTAEGIMLLRSKIAKLDKKIQHFDNSISRIIKAFSIQDEEYIERLEIKQELESERAQLHSLLKEAEIIEERQKSDKASDSIVDLGNKIHLVNHTVSYTVTIVDSVEANPLEGKVSSDSPIGSSVLGKKLGEVVNIMLPTGLKEFTIAAIL